MEEPITQDNIEELFKNIDWDKAIEDSAKRRKKEQDELKKQGLYNYEDVGILPLMKENESLEEFSKRVQIFIEEGKGPEWMNESTWVERHLVVGLNNDDNIPTAKAIRQKLDAICNAYANIGKEVVYYSMDTWNTGGVKCPKRKENESIEEWSNRLDKFCFKIRNKEFESRGIRK